MYRDALMAMYTELAKLTEDLVATTTIRQRTFQEIHKSLDGINEMLKAASKLRGNSEGVSPSTCHISLVHILYLLPTNNFKIRFGNSYIACQYFRFTLSN